MNPSPMGALRRLRDRAGRWVGASLLLLLAGGVGLAAPSEARAQSPDGYRLSTPRASFSVKMGYAAPRTSSEVFDFIQDTLTVGPRDFDALSLGAELALRVSERLDVTFDLGYARGESFSEFRNWVDQDDLPIQQSTSFRRTPLTVGARAYLLDRGTQVGSFAWVPRSWAPYVGGGVGYMWYEFVQRGDFVDFQTLDIFNDRLRSAGGGFTAHGLAGVEVSLGSQFVLTTEGRYRFGNAGMNRDFGGAGDQGFGDIDLSGFEVNVGLGLRF